MSDNWPTDPNRPVPPPGPFGPPPGPSGPAGPSFAPPGGPPPSPGQSSGQPYPPGPGYPPAGPYPPAGQYPPTGQYPPGGPYQPSGSTAQSSPSSGGSGRRIVAVVVGLAVIAAAALFAVTRLGSDSTSAGGADTPEAAGEQFLAAIENEDVLGIIDVLLPGERATFYDPARDLASELRRLEVLSDDASLSDVGGLEVDIADERVEVTPTNVDDIVQLHLGGTITASVDGEALPVGDLIRDNLPDFDPAEADVDEASDAIDLTMAAVERDGRWYVSAFYTVGVLAVGGQDIPETGIEPVGGDSPEDAFDNFLNGFERVDLGRMIGTLNPDEFEALQRFAPLFLGDAQRAVNDAQVRISFEDPEYSVSGSGDTRSITLTSLSGTLSAEDETATFEWADGCLIARVPGQDEVNTCEVSSGAFEEATQQSPAVGDLFETLQSSLDDIDNPGILAKRVDGEWYLSPLGTGAEQLLSVMRALDRDEIEAIGTDIGDVIDELGGIDSMTDEFDLPGD